MSDIELEPITRELTTQEKAYEQIKKSILSGSISSKTIFTEGQLADTLKTSRTPVRAALQDLLNEGLVTLVPRKGVMVREITEDEQEELFLIRTAIETEVIRRVVNQITENQIDKLKKICEEQKEAMQIEDGVRFIELDLKFHLTIVNISNFSFINQVLMNSHDLLTLTGLKALSQQDRATNVLAEHEKIVAALKKKDAELASEYMKEHLLSTKETLQAVDSKK